ncbi:MAG TPA: hypothetical protein VH540_03005 [Ktedonobacterales bacterium]|jgi:hypothetical protein
MRRFVEKKKLVVGGFYVSEEALVLYQYLCQYRLDHPASSPSFAEMTAYFQAKGRTIGRGKLTECLEELEGMGVIERAQGQHRGITITRLVLEFLQYRPAKEAGTPFAPESDVAAPGHVMDRFIQELLSHYLKQQQVSGVITIDGRLMYLSEPALTPGVSR